MFLLSNIKKLDYFGPTVQFTIRRESNFKTFFGGLFSIVSFALYFLLFYSFGSDLFNNDNPSVFQQTNYFRPSDKPSYEINNNNFIVSFNLKKNTLIFKGLKPEDFTYRAYFKKIANASRIGKGESTELKFINCSNFLEKTNLFKNDVEYFNQKTKGHLCLDIPEGDKYSLQGIKSSFPWHFVQIKLFLKPNNNTCKITKDLESLTESEAKEEIPFHYPIVGFNPKNYTSPFHVDLQSSIVGLDFRYSTTIDSYLYHHLLNQDDGIFLPNEKKITMFSFKQSNTFPTVGKFDYRAFENHCKNKDESYLKNEKNMLLNLQLHLSLDYNQEYFRSYKKIQDVLGNINGVMDIVNKVFLILISLYSNYRLDYFLINSNINVRGEDSNDNNKDNNKNSDIENKKVPRFDNDIADLRSKRHKSVIGTVPRMIEMQRRKKLDLLSEESDDKSHRVDLINKEEDEKSYNKNNINNNENGKSSIISQIKKSSTIEDIPSKIKNNNDNDKYNSSNNNNKNNGETSEMIKNISKYMEPKKTFLEMNLFYYVLRCNKFCGTDKNKKLHLKMLSYFSEKITSKLDIMYYFKLIKKVKNLQTCLFPESEQGMFFDILSKDLYPLKLEVISDDKFFEREKCDKKNILIDYYKNADNNNFNSDEIMNEVFPSLLGGLL